MSTATVTNAVAELRDNGYLSDDTRASLTPDQLVLVEELARGGNP